MQKLLFAVFGAVCVLTSASEYRSSGDRSYGDRSYGGQSNGRSYGGDDKLEIRHSSQEKSYGKGDGYGKGDDNGYGKSQEGYSTRFFELQSNKGKTITI